VRRSADGVSKIGSIALFMGKKAVEKAVTWKSPKPGLFHSTWKSSKERGISHFFHRHDFDDFRISTFRGKENS
jgi:hypothetical protein